MLVKFLNLIAYSTTKDTTEHKSVMKTKGQTQR